MSKPTILLIEDEPGIAEVVVYAFSREGYECAWEKTSVDGLQAFLQRSPALVILDVGLPDRSGFEVCKDIRRHSQTPVLFLTARAEEIDRIVGFEIGGDDYLIKPFSPRELVARVKAILRRAPANNHGVKGDHPFVIDEERLKIRFRDVELDLTRYEYRLLKALVEKPGRVYSREQLMALVWEEPENSFDRTVDTHIKTLRAKLRAIDPHRNPIKTHRGLGYSLEWRA